MAGLDELGITAKGLKLAEDVFMENPDIRIAVREIARRLEDKDYKSPDGCACAIMAGFLLRKGNAKDIEIFGAILYKLIYGGLLSLTEEAEGEGK